MKALNRNQKWVSNVFEQESYQVEDWGQYAVEITGGAEKIPFRDSDTTSTNLAAQSLFPIADGQRIVLTEDGSTMIDAQAGTTSTGAATIFSVTPSGAISTLGGQTTVYVGDIPGLYRNDGRAAQQAQIHPNGTKLWVASVPGGGTASSIVEYEMTTPWDVSTLTSTGASISALNYTVAGPGFSWSRNGKTLFMGSTPDTSTSIKNITQFHASTPYSLGSIDLDNSQQYEFATAGTSNFDGGANDINTLQASRDGQWLMVNGAGYTNPFGSLNTSLYMSQPGQITTTARYTPTNQSISGNNISGTGCYTITADGRFVIKMVPYSTTGVGGCHPKVWIYGLSTPYEFSSLSSTIVAELDFVGELTHSNNGVYVDNYLGGAVGISPCARYLFIATKKDTAPDNRTISQMDRAYMIDLHALGLDLYTPTNVDITGHSLTSAPVKAWSGKPRMFVSAETSPDRCNVDNYELGYKKLSSTTTSLVIGSDKVGLLKAGDQLIVDDNTTVTITSVVETSNGFTVSLPYPPTTGSANIEGLQFTGRTLQTGSGGSQLSHWSTSTSSNIKIVHGDLHMSTDGRFLYVVTCPNDTSSAYKDIDNYTNGVARFHLTEPWNIDTAIQDQFTTFGYTRTERVSTIRRNIPNYFIAGVVISPDGTKVVVNRVYNTGAGTQTGASYLHGYTLEAPWDLTTAVYTGEAIAPAVGQYIPIKGLTSNADGTSMVVVASQVDANAGYAKWLNYTLSTPWDVTTATPGIWNFAGYAGGGDWGTAMALTYDGKYYIHNGGYYNNINYWGHVTMNTLSVPGSISSGFSLSKNGSVERMNFATQWQTTTGSQKAILGIAVSYDGTKMYVNDYDGTIYQYNTCLQTLNQYTCTIPQLPTVPTTVKLPARTSEVVFNSITKSSADSDVLVFASNETLLDSDIRAIQFKIDGNEADATIDSIKINLWRS
jgi:hypothetical protein